jgi:hypothetical protein
VLLHVEDGQWLDDESLAFVQQVAESTSATVLLTAPVTRRRRCLPWRGRGAGRLEVQLPKS